MTNDKCNFSLVFKFQNMKYILITNSGAPVTSAVAARYSADNPIREESDGCTMKTYLKELMEMMVSL